MKLLWVAIKKALLGGSVVSGMYVDIKRFHAGFNAIYYGCVSNLSPLRHKRVKVFTDSQSAGCIIVSIGSTTANS